MAEETEVPVQTPQPTPYIDKVYSALKDNLQGFNKTPEQFKQSMQDSGYAAKAYSALKDNLQGFNKSQDEFYQATGVKTNRTPQAPNPLLDPLNPQQSTPYDYVTTSPQAAQRLAKDTNAHSEAIQTAQQQKQFKSPNDAAIGSAGNPLNQPKAKPKEDSSIFDDVANALYLPAFNQGFNDLVVKPAAGATDFIDRTIDKAYQGITGSKTPSWLRKKGAFDNLSNDLQRAYDERPKPKNIVSETAESTVGTLPLIASMFTGSGEASLATKAPQFVSKVTKLLATTGAASAYKDATDQGKGYTQSLGEAATGAEKGAVQGLTLDAQMLLGGALGKGVVNKLVEKGLLKGGKAGEALVHAIANGTVFGGTSAGEDLLQGKDIDTHEAAKQFGMGLAFEMIPVAKGLSDEVGNHIEKSDINKKAAQNASLVTAASNLNGEAALRTLMSTPKEQLLAIHDNIPESHETLYANSVEQGMKAYDEKNLSEKKALYADQLLLKTQGDVKLIASKLKDNAPEVIQSINESQELSPEQKTDLLDKVQALTPQNEQAKPNEKLPAEAPSNEPGKAEEPVAAVNEAPKDNLTTNPNKNESTNDEKGSGEESSQSGQKSREVNGGKTEGVSTEKGLLKRERIADKDAPKVEELARNLKPKGEPGISVEPSFERAYEKPNDLTDKELDNGQKYVVSRDKDGRVNGVLEVSYQSDKGVEKEPQAVKVAVDEGSRRQGIATALFKHAEEQGIDLKDVRGKATTDAGQALYEANKKGENKDAIKEIGQQESSGPKHQKGNESGETPKAGDRNSPVGAKESTRKEEVNLSSKDAVRKSIESETDPKKIAVQYHKEDSRADTKEQAIIDYLGNSKINERDYNRWGDSKRLGDHTDPKRLRWIDSKNSDKTGLDIHADIISHDIGVPVSPEDIIDVVDKYKGKSDFDEQNKTDTQKLLEKRYQELTGNKLTKGKAEKAFGEHFAKLSLSDHSELNNILREDHGISIKDLKDEQQERNASGQEPAETPTNAEAVQQPENDSAGNDGTDRRGGKDEKGQGTAKQGEAAGQDKQTANEVKGKDLSPKAKKVKTQSLTDEELNRKLELRKKFSGYLNDITNIPTLLADKEFREYAGLVFKEAAGDFKAFSKELIDYVGEKIKPHLSSLWGDLGGDAKEASDIEQKATYGTKNAITEELQQGLGLPPIEIPKDRTDDESLAAWKDGKRTPQEITEQLLDPDTNIYDKKITPNDEPIMREYIRQLGERGKELTKIKLHLQEKADAGDEQAKLDVASVTQQINNHLDEYNNALNASKVGGNIWHKYGDERQKAIDDKGLILNAIERIRNIYGADIPTDVKKQLDDLQKRHDELLAKNEALQEKIKNGRAQEVFEKAKAKRTILGTKKLSDAEFTSAKADILEALKKDWKKSFAKTYATLPGIPQLNALAPHIAKLMKLYADRGISKLDDVIRNIHDDVKDDIEGITTDDIKDLIAGRYSANRPLSDLQKQVNELRTQARNKVKIAELEKGILAKTKPKGEASPEVKALQKEVSELKKKVINEHASYSAEELKKQAAAIQKQIDKGEFAKQPIVKRRWDTDPEWIKNNREKADLTFKLRQLEQDAMNSKKGRFMRSLDWTNRWGRRVIFFGANAVYTKLSSAAVLGSFLHRMPEQVLGKLNAKMFPNIARTAPIEGNINLRNEGQWYLDFVNPKEFAIDVKDIIMTGETRLSKSMDTHPPGVHIPIVDLFAADGHQIIKSMVKRATFNAAFNYQMDWFQKNGIDATHPMIIEAARQAAWQRANYEIFQDNPKNQTKIKEYFNQLERSGILNRNKPDGWSKIQGNAQYSAAALYHFFIPINTVPVNILKRVGLGLKLPATYLEAIKKNKAVRDGILNMTHEESDAILIQLKKGQVAAAYWTLGFVLAGTMAGGMYTKFYSNQERDKDAVTPDADYLNFRGLNVSKDVQHNTQFQALQMGATWRMVHDHYVDDKGESQLMSIFAATAATGGVAAQEHPVISTVKNLLDAAETPHGNTKWVKDLRRRIGIQKAQDVFKLMGYDGFGDDSEDYATPHK